VVAERVEFADSRPTDDAADNAGEPESGNLDHGRGEGAGRKEFRGGQHQQSQPNKRNGIRA
jgi:hypothetical protein